MLEAAYFASITDISLGKLLRVFALYNFGEIEADENIEADDSDVEADAVVAFNNNIEADENNVLYGAVQQPFEVAQLMVLLRCYRKLRHWRMSRNEVEPVNLDRYGVTATQIADYIRSRKQSRAYRGSVFGEKSRERGDKHWLETANTGTGDRIRWANGAWEYYHKKEGAWISENANTAVRPSDRWTSKQKHTPIHHTAGRKKEEERKFRNFFCAFALYNFGVHIEADDNDAETDAVAADRRSRWSNFLRSSVPFEVKLREFMQ
uniref:Sin3a_C domain-containing protein n=1 Tax=Steinernema glaseri TaxID=37863 RepID=A0A1I7YQD2_9BILA